MDLDINTLVLDKLDTANVSKRPYKATRATFNATSDQEKRRKVSLDNQRRKRTVLVESGRQIEQTVLKIESDYELMLSEWFQEMPPDFDTLWRMLVCPLGKRSLVIAKSGVTRVYTRKGIRVNTFQSGLPGGSRNGYSGVTVIDAIYCRDETTYFVLDVLTWNGHCMLECETEFR